MSNKTEWKLAASPPAHVGVDGTEWDDSSVADEENVEVDPFPSS